MIKVNKQNTRYKKRKRIRAKIYGTAQRPRISIFRSNLVIYLQAIDDDHHKTLAFSSSLKDKEPTKTIAKKLMDQKIKKIVFDRSGYKYHGRISKIADQLRKEGLEF